jgi:hypothetical protein
MTKIEMPNTMVMKGISTLKLGLLLDTFSGLE